jgi:3-hydroxypropanoate dehydrogenase
MAAPATAIIAWDTESHETLPRVFPQRAMRSYFIAEQTLIDETAFRNSPLQATYFILAARALGLDCVPMSWFDADRLNAEFSRRQVESESSLQSGLWRQKQARPT